MNTKYMIGAVLGLSLALDASGVTLLSDDFNGTAINSSLWQASTPFSNSSMTESGGNAVFKNRGILVSQANIPGPLDIRGSFEFTGDLSDNFVVVTRTDGTVNGSNGGLNNGIYVVFSINGFGNPGNILIQDGQLSRLGYGAFTFTKNIFYNFRVVDNGQSITGYVNDLANPLFSIATSQSYGQHIGFFNRERTASTDDIVNLDFLSVTAVPEPGVLALFAVGCLTLGLKAKAGRQ